MNVEIFQHGVTEGYATTMELRSLKGKNVICEVQKGSIAEELGIEPGDFIHSINGTPVEDIIEYTFLQSDEYIELEIEKANGDLYIYDIEKDYDEELGIEFSNPIIDAVRTCNNDCVFCFVNQLPEGMRKTLYIKDDDSRLSFLQGNFITMTNMKDKDIDRMIRYRISPVNISVHTTNPELRAKMLHNKHAGDIMRKIQKLADADLTMNGQIVCVPEYNDKDELEKTVRDLSKFHPNMQSIAVVPVGITKHRKNLPSLKTFDKDSSKELINLIEGLQQEFLEKFGTRFIFASDEFYIMADLDVPEDESYENYIQIENGVGLIKKFETQILQCLEELQKKEHDCTLQEEKRITIATGASAYCFMKKIACLVEKQFDNLSIDVVKIDNHFFGTTITVAGLITGTDLYEQLKDRELGNALLLPRVMFRSDDLVFLDDITKDALEHRLNTRIVVTEIDGNDFINKIKQIAC